MRILRHTQGQVLPAMRVLRGAAHQGAVPRDGLRDEALGQHGQVCRVAGHDEPVGPGQMRMMTGQQPQAEDKAN